ncbi:MAG: exo-alpha-sialidase [Bacteroidales bacterium]|nr:exo-alpha-sialidase [Bacteroidales bacterium]MCB8999212.1 exo-alpha-sialidase [Bacteroidales bacterium]
MKYNTLSFIFLLTNIIIYSCQIEDNTNPIYKKDNSITIQVGTRKVLTNKFTNNLQAVVPMWGVGIPRNSSLFSTIQEAEHAIVWQPKSLTDGAYNHYACLANFKGKFYAMWGNNTIGEDAPGQRVLFSTSDSWGTWSDAKELFPAPGPLKPRSEVGIHLKPDRWAIIEDVLYAIVYIHEAGRYPIACSVNENGLVGNPFLLDSLSSNSSLPEFMQQIDISQLLTPSSPKLKQWYIDNDQINWWADSESGVIRNGIDGSQLIESFIYRAKDNTKVIMMRCWGTSSNPVHNNRMYVSFKDENGDWGLLYPTDIPDSPSRSQAITLDDGTVLLIGNQIAPEFDKAIYLDRDPMTVAVSKDGFIFDEVYNLRIKAPNYYRFSGIGGRNPGFAYSSSLVFEGWLYTLYSVGKEDMEITRVPLSAMNL